MQIRISAVLKLEDKVAENKDTGGRGGIGIGLRGLTEC